MEHRANTVQRPAYNVALTDIPRNELHLGRQVGGRTIRPTVHLRHQAVEDPHFVARGQQLIRDMRADETRTARDQDFSTHE